MTTAPPFKAAVFFLKVEPLILLALSVARVSAPPDVEVVLLSKVASEIFSAFTTGAVINVRAAAVATTSETPFFWTELVNSFATISVPRALLNTTLNVEFMFI